MLSNFTTKLSVLILLFLHISFTQIYQFYHFHHTEHENDAKLILSVHPINHESNQEPEGDQHDTDDVHFEGDWIFRTQNFNSYSNFSNFCLINTITGFSSRLNYICTIQDFTQHVKLDCYSFHLHSRSPP